MGGSTWARTGKPPKHETERSHWTRWELSWSFTGNAYKMRIEIVLQTFGAFYLSDCLHWTESEAGAGVDLDGRQGGGLQRQCLKDWDVSLQTQSQPGGYLGRWERPWWTGRAKLITSTPSHWAGWSEKEADLRVFPFTTKMKDGGWSLHYKMMLN